MAKEDSLVAARVGRRVADVLEAAAFVRRLSMQRLLAPAIERFAQQLSEDPDVKTAINARTSADRRKGAPVTPIKGVRRRDP
jgi:DNA topoisomerase IA